MSLTFGILNMMCHGVSLFASILLGILYASWMGMSISFTKLGKISFLQFLALYLFFLGPPMNRMLVLLKLSQNLLIVSSFFKVYFIDYAITVVPVFSPFIQLHHAHPPPCNATPSGSCPWVVHISFWLLHFLYCS